MSFTFFVSGGHAVTNAPEANAGDLAPVKVARMEVMSNARVFIYDPSFGVVGGDDASRGPIGALNKRSAKWLTSG
jgi:hypothetical protein